MLPDLPSQLLRSFVAVVDCGSLAEAARRLDRSDSALSLQMSRLEDLVGQPLFDRDGRTLRLNQTGSQLLGHARAILARVDAARNDLAQVAPPLRIGIVQDFVGTVLRSAMADLRHRDPAALFEIYVAGTGDLLKQLGAGGLDIALCASTFLDDTNAISFQAAWFGNHDLLDRDVLPLVTVTPPCPYLAAAQSRLDKMGRAYRLAVITPSLDGARAAVEAGLGIACRTQTGIGLPRLNHAGRLPPLPPIPYGVAVRGGLRDDGKIAALLSEHLAQLARDDGQSHEGIAP